MQLEERNDSMKGLILGAVLSLALWTLIMSVAVLIFYAVSEGAQIVVPPERTFIYKAPFFSLGKQPTVYHLKGQIYNPESAQPQRIRIYGERVSYAESGKVAGAGEKLSADPSETVIYPGETLSFQIAVPIQKTGSSIVAVCFMPVLSPQKGKVLIASGGGYNTMIHWGKPTIKPELMITQEDGKIQATVKNAGEFAIRGNLYFNGAGGKEVKRYVLVEAHRQRVYRIENTGFDSVVLDADGLKHRLGRRLK